MKAAALGLALFGGLAWTGAHAAEFRIGVSAPLSGADAIFGEQIRLGTERAVADSNVTGGFLGQRGRVVARDDGNDPKRAADVANTFVAEQEPVIVGPLSSSATVAASAVYADAGRVEITPSALAPAVTERGLATVFRTCGRDDEQAEVASRFLLSRRIARIAIVHDRTTAGKDLADGVRKGLAGAGIREAFYGSLEKGARDLSALVNRIRTSGAQAAFFGGSAAEAGVLARQLREANLRLTFLGGAALASDDFATSAGPAAEGTVMVFPQDPKSRPAAADLLRRLRGEGIEPDALVFYAYAGVQVIRQAVDGAKSLDPKAIAATMHDGRVFRTVLGDIAFDTKGDPTSADYTVYVWHKGASGRMTFDDKAKS